MRPCESATDGSARHRLTIHTTLDTMTALAAFGSDAVRRNTMRRNTMRSPVTGFSIWSPACATGVK